MATLAIDTPRDYQLGGFEEYPIVAADIIYEGAAVGINAGFARPLVAGDVFVGFAQMNADNSTGAQGDKLVRVKTQGRAKLSISGLAITANNRAAVYASDDNTFTLTSAGNSKIGWVSRWISTGVAIVEFEALEV